MSGKRLYLLRHAQAASAAISDFDRPLTESGLQDAAALGRMMAEKNMRPALAVCSSALRTRQTGEAVAKALGEGFEIRYDKGLYNASKGALFGVIQEAADARDSLMIIGHNPAIHELAAWFSAKGSERLIGRLAQGYQPATLAVIDLPCEKWADAQPDEGELIELLTPMDYNAPARPTRWM